MSDRNTEVFEAYCRNRKRKSPDMYDYRDINGEYAFTLLDLGGPYFCANTAGGGFVPQPREGKAAVFGAPEERLKDAILKEEHVYYCQCEKDVRVLESHGLAAVTCGRSAGDWDGRCAALFADADVVILQRTDLEGHEISEEVRRDLEPVAKSVRVVVPVPDAAGGGAAEFLELHTVSELEQLLEQDLDQFHLFNERGRATGVYDAAIFQYLKVTQDIFVLGGIPYIYRHGVFRPDLSGAELKTMIRRLIYPQFVKSTTIKRIYELFLSDAELQTSVEQLNDYPAEWINFQNGFYDPKSKRMIPHAAKYKAVNQIPHDYDPEAELRGAMVQDWLRFISEDPEDIEMLTQFAGLCMTRDTRQQKFLILNGEGGTGKSTVIRMIDKMIGAENISNISLNQLTQRFAAFGLLGKLMNSCADLEIDALSDVSMLKKVLGEDTLSAEAKGKDAISFRSYAKLIFSANELPIVKAEKTNGFYRRLLVLTMNRAPERQEPDFFDRLSADMDDFIRICVRALEKLYQAGRITESKGSADAVKRLRYESDTVEAFIASNLRICPDDPQHRTTRSAMFDEYQEYCKAMGRQSLTKQNFFRSMKTKGWSCVKTGGIVYYCGAVVVNRVSTKNWSEEKEKYDDPYSGAEEEEHGRAV